jgi:hypothetical protein
MGNQFAALLIGQSEALFEFTRAKDALCLIWEDLFELEGRLYNVPEDLVAGFFHL